MDRDELLALIRHNAEQISTQAYRLDTFDTPNTKRATGITGNAERIIELAKQLYAMPYEPRHSLNTSLNQLIDAGSLQNDRSVRHQPS